MSDFPTQILLYTGEAEIKPADLKRLAKGGLIPVRVSDLASVKIVQAAVPLPVSPDAFLMAAMRAISSFNDPVKAEFFNQLLRAMEAERKRDHPT